MLGNISASGRLIETDFETHYARLRSQARRLVGHAEDAEDVVQDAMERAWRFRDRFAPGAAAGPWLAAIMRRAAIDRLKARGATQPMDETLATHDLTEAVVLRNETVISLATAIRGLAPAFRTAIVEHDVLGYSNREIATRASIPYHTARTSLFRARKALRGAYRGGVAA